MKNKSEVCFLLFNKNESAYKWSVCVFTQTLPILQHLPGFNEKWGDTRKIVNHEWLQILFPRENKWTNLSWMNNGINGAQDIHIIVETIHQLMSNNDRFDSIDRTVYKTMLKAVLSEWCLHMLILILTILNKHKYIYICLLISDVLTCENVNVTGLYLYYQFSHLPLLTELVCQW